MTEKTKPEFKPLGSKVLLEVVEPDTIVDGIFIPTHFNRRNPPRAIVVTTGPDATDVKKGDVVFYQQIGNVFPLEGYTLVLERDLLAIVE